MPVEHFTIKSAGGVGDSVYLYPIAKYLKKYHESIMIVTDWPMIFEPLGVKTTWRISSVGKKNSIPAQMHLSYCKYKFSSERKDCTQFEDLLLSAHLDGKGIEMKMDWTIKNKKFIDQVNGMRTKKKICVIHEPFAPFGRSDALSAEMVIKHYAFDNLLARLRSKYYIIAVGLNKHVLVKMSNVDLDLCDHTSIDDMLDICKVSDLMVSQTGHFIPIAQAFDKKLMCMMSSKGLASQQRFISSITPNKLFFKSTDRYCIDAENMGDVVKRNREFLCL